MTNYCSYCGPVTGRVEPLIKASFPRLNKIISALRLVLSQQKVFIYTSSTYVEEFSFLCDKSGLNIFVLEGDGAHV